MTASPFAAIPYSPRQHFALYFHAAVLRVLDLARAHFDSVERHLRSETPGKKRAPRPLRDRALWFKTPSIIVEVERET